MTTAGLTEQFVLGNYGRFPISFTHGEGSYLWDEDGRRYLDFVTGIAVCALGHCPEVMKNALTEQGGKLIHVSNLYQIREQAELAQFVVEKMMERPGKVFFCNSGAEANDGLIKLARKRAFDKYGAKAGKNVIITCKQSFHGRTLGGIAATAQEKVKIGFDPLLPGFLHVPFNDIETLKEAVNEHTAAILFEPLQGEGGINPATPEFMAAAAELCQSHDALLMFDEVQCGSGRTGDWCGWRTLLEGTGIEVEPDAVSWAKGFGGGFPIGSFWASDDCAGALGPGTHGSTFGGTPLGSAVSLALLKAIDEGGVLENVKRQEKRIKDAVAAWGHPLIDSLRGAGLMLGFVVDGEVLRKQADFVESGKTPSLYVVNAAMEAGMLTVPAGENVVRWLPRLDVPDEEVDEALGLFKKVLDSLI
ncbi:MAG: acetylornithine/succinylornithine family transaminase [Verrucomicrobiales bacterium]|nr:acetylornithine/succinylornithine family transaminase [Verrucomicrobiales bacterium]